MPDTSMALTIMRVRRKGTFSGNFSRCWLASKQSPKSMCSSLPASVWVGVVGGEAECVAVGPGGGWEGGAAG